MLEITLIELSDNFDEQFESLNKFFSQFTFRSLVDYAIVADGFGIAYASYFAYTKRKQLLPRISIYINPDFRALKRNPAYNKLPEDDCYKNKCLDINHGISIFSYNNLNLLEYHQKHYGGNYLLLPQKDIFSAIKELFSKSGTGDVTISYLKTQILTPRYRVIPADYPIISVNGSFEWFGEKMFNSRIPESAFRFRDWSCTMATPFYLIKGDVIESYSDDICRCYQYLDFSEFLDLNTGERVRGQLAPFSVGRVPGIFPDWTTRWSLRDVVTYKLCVPFGSLKKNSIGFDKYGNEFKIIAVGVDALIEFEENDEVIKKRDPRCTEDQYIAGYFPKSNHPHQIYLLPYSYEGIMFFKRRAKKRFRTVMKMTFHHTKNKDTEQ